MQMLASFMIHSSQAYASCWEAGVNAAAVEARQMRERVFNNTDNDNSNLPKYNYDPNKP